MAKNRNESGLSQRAMAERASLSFRTVQLLESGEHDPKISTLINIAKALGYPPEAIKRHLDLIFDQPVDSVLMTSEKILHDGEGSWKLWVFNFVDAFRREGDAKYVELPPSNQLSEGQKAMMASIVETLCEELNVKMPAWCGAVAALKNPWFVSGLENLKAIALAESPIHFRKRNIFVLGNFLERR